MEYVKYWLSLLSFHSLHTFSINVLNVKNFGFCFPQAGDPRVSSLNCFTLSSLELDESTLKSMRDQRQREQTVFSLQLWSGNQLHLWLCFSASQWWKSSTTRDFWLIWLRCWKFCYCFQALLQQCSSHVGAQLKTKMTYFHVLFCFFDGQLTEQRNKCCAESYGTRCLEPRREDDC